MPALTRRAPKLLHRVNGHKHATADDHEEPTRSETSSPLSDLSVTPEQEVDDLLRDPESSDEDQENEAPVWAPPKNAAIVRRPGGCKGASGVQNIHAPPRRVTKQAEVNGGRDEQNKDTTRASGRFKLPENKAVKRSPPEDSPTGIDAIVFSSQDAKRPQSSYGGSSQRSKTYGKGNKARSGSKRESRRQS